MDYTSYVATMANLLVIPDYATNAPFQSMLPRMIEYAENRMYREFDFLDTSTDASAVATPNARRFTVPSPIFIVESVNVITPSSTLPDNGLRVPLERVSVEAMNYMWPDATETGIPILYAMLDQGVMLLAPTPSSSFYIEVFGEFRPEPLSSTNTTTFLTTWLPDVFVAASMVFGTGWQRDFGQQADDPKVAMSWEQQYGLLSQGAQVEEARKQAASTGWQPFQPTPLAKPARGE